LGGVPEGPGAVCEARARPFGHAAKKKIMQTIPLILRPGSGESAIRLRARAVIPLIVVAGALSGAVMGSFGGIGPSRWAQILFSAIKVPMLLGVSFGLTLPSFFVLSTLLGLRSDFRLAVRAAATAQAGLAITLVSLSPFVALWYASSRDYPLAILFNGGMFAIATMTGQALLRRNYRSLIARHPRHRAMMRSWTIVYAFIAIQMAWVLRPFVGGPSEPTTFFRQGAWGNAYVVIGELILKR
jgi:hypothetical protein